MSFLLSMTNASVRDYPSRPITLMVPYALGSRSDLTARCWAEFVGKELNVPIVIDNRLGLEGLTGLRHAASQAHDGYTLIYATAALVASERLASDSRETGLACHLQPISMLRSSPQLVISRTGSGIRSISDLIERGSQAPVRYGATEGGCMQALAQSVNKKYGVKMLQVSSTSPFDAAPDLLGISVDDDEELYGAHLLVQGSNTYEPIAVVGATRLERFPHVPTWSEFGMPNIPPAGWHALFAPRGTQPGVLLVLEKETRKFLRSEVVYQRLGQNMLQPANFGAHALQGALDC